MHWKLMTLLSDLCWNLSLMCSGCVLGLFPTPASAGTVAGARHHPTRWDQHLSARKGSSIIQCTSCPVGDWVWFHTGLCLGFWCFFWAWVWLGRSVGLRNLLFSGPAEIDAEAPEKSQKTGSQRSSTFCWYPVGCSSAFHFSGKQKANLWYY